MQPQIYTKIFKSNRKLVEIAAALQYTLAVK